MAYLLLNYVLYHEHSVESRNPPWDFDSLGFVGGHQEAGAPAVFDFQVDFFQSIDDLTDDPMGVGPLPNVHGRYDDAAHQIWFHDVRYGLAGHLNQVIFSGTTINSADNEYVVAMTGTFHHVVTRLRPRWETIDAYLGVWAAAHNAADARALEAQAERRERVATFIPRGS